MVVAFPRTLSAALNLDVLLLDFLLTIDVSAREDRSSGEEGRSHTEADDERGLVAVDSLRLVYRRWCFVGVDLHPTVDDDVLGDFWDIHKIGIIYRICLWETWQVAASDEALLGLL